MTDDTILTALMVWLDAVTGATVADIFGTPTSGLMGDGPALYLSVVSRVTEPDDEYDGTQWVVSARDRVRMQVTAIGTDAVGWLRQASRRWGDPTSASDTLRATMAPIGGTERANVTNQNRQGPTSTTPRATMDLIAYVVYDVTTEAVDSVESIQVDLDGSTLLTIPEPTP